MTEGEREVEREREGERQSSSYRKNSRYCFCSIIRIVFHFAAMPAALSKHMTFVGL